MNWNSRAVDAVSKERIWREHVLAEKNTARVHEDFRCNPLKKNEPTPDNIAKRPARFLDRSAVIMDMLQKRLGRVKKNENKEQRRLMVERGLMSQAEADAADAHELSMSASGGAASSAASSARSNNNNNNNNNFQLPTRGMYGSSARPLEVPSKLPPLSFGASSSSAAAAAAAGGNNKNSSVPISPRSHGSTNKSKSLGSPRTRGTVRVDDFDTLYSSASLTPREKYAVPQTAMQELGWWDKPLVTQRELEPRFRYGLSSCEITKNGSQFVGSRRK